MGFTPESGKLFSESSGLHLPAPALIKVQPAPWLGLPKPGKEAWCGAPRLQPHHERQDGADLQDRKITCAGRDVFLYFCQGSKWISAFAVLHYASYTALCNKRAFIPSAETAENRSKHPALASHLGLSTQARSCMVDRNEGRSPGGMAKVALKNHVVGTCAALTAVQPVLPWPPLGSTSDKPLLMQLGYRCNFMEKKQWFFPTFIFKRVTTSLHAVSNWWRDELLPLTTKHCPLFNGIFLVCPVKASRCWMETTMDKWRDAMAGGGEGEPPLAELFPLHSPHGGCKGGSGGSRAEAAFRWEPPSRTTLPSTLRSQMHLGIWQGASGFTGFVVCLGWRTLGAEGGEHGASADKMQECSRRNQKRNTWKEEDIIDSISEV